MTMPRRQRRSAAKQSRAEGIEQEPILVPMRWVGTDDLPILMANQIFIRYMEGQIILTFGQATPPYELQISKDTIAQLQREGAPCRAVARVSVAPIKFSGMVRALNEIQSRLKEMTEQ
ncbi:MAG: hypothetical protein V1724_03530, partial [Chloroflexota bacterium]